ncbi:nuclear factor of activated T-cells, cytoplasmic 2 isoform X2 [Anguilla anguilla]|uniref:nuclear factor of activated T-cells, cytoplasmic 2 isoform X2 n=1 Tax=Anguilla anguilla TaxID=7936 RepID=UPI0015B24F2A|nr:nuclear factor of activated T-cells, cytoplasmic 2 isoform X2 [Anguilla anguilla]
MTSIYEDKDPSALELAEELSQVNCQDELDFDYLFEYDPPCNDFPAEDQDEQSLSSHKAVGAPVGAAYPLEEVAPYGIKSCPSPYDEPPPEGLGGYEHLDGKRYLEHPRAGGPGTLSPRIKITPSRELYTHGQDSLQTHPLGIGPRTLAVPGQDSLAYREPQCLSPASSNSSTSWHSESYSPWASPCVSPSNGQATTGDLCPRFQNIHAGSSSSPRTSPGASPHDSATDEGCLAPHSPSPRPGSRSTSPQGKRTYDMYRNPGLAPARHRSRSPSPHSAHDERQGGIYGPGPCPSVPGVPGVPGVPCVPDSLNGFCGVPGSVPTKIVKTASPAYSLYLDSQPEGYLFSCDQDMKSKQPGAESFFVIPPIWPKQLVPGICSIPVASLPPLEWPLPKRTDQYELHIDVQPKPHHRAHYETEGSRGAVKAANGGHPVVQLHGYRGKEPLGLQIFIGTADERILKPHAFYQVHRITGKTVTTTSYEKIINSTKVLEIPLEPKNNMKAMIDCAGILKLRNADIELRKGETDIGRKNTRVRLVFRVHIPQPGGQHVSLQVASHPIECSQRSAHELPMVEKQDVDSCSALGGQQMILTGQNFTSDSKVVFTEKTHDGQQIWEAEATVDKDKSQSSMLFVEIPSYRDPSICHSAKVNFYVINGKRKRSQPQHFTYTPLAVPSIKTEPVDDYEAGQMGFPMPQVLGVSPQQYYHAPHGPRALLNPDSCLVGAMAPCQQALPGLVGPEPRFQQQSPAIVYPRGPRGPSASPALYPQPSGAIPVPDPHRSVLVHTGSPAGPPTSSPGGHPSIIQFSPTNHLLRGAAPPPMSDHHMYYPQQGAPSARSPAPAQHYPTVIQQQPYAQKGAKSRSPPPEDQRVGGVPARVTVKQENLDQAYLDDVRLGRTDAHGHGQHQRQQRQQQQQRQ